ncbi:dihydrolipoamide acetyltransferase family protein [Kibdelosporangium aridum]|uniref:Dihydrolipoamide acetyltransferase component of pyruvate dehydrogenase complex n=1 Tax=Kibdelosporangium aridum TaxID=2030 RepID=A0A1Y5WUV1_KIBAR|nr:dihydrolipoamide acetyltransferase family protein [Kibdelosporangium aridum]SMC52647.1 pyruvate dehydrogenase E2 component (dihydrolipoamide acetyltransferase) [Kibdelosporangium aridum]
MATLLRVPEVATGSTSALLTEWLVAENARFAAGDPLVVLETDKAAVEVEAEVDAVLLRALVPGGTNVETGSPIALLGSEAEAGDVDKLLAELGVGATSAEEAGPEPAQRERVFASPLARKLLKEAGMTPDQVTGTGPDGRIVRRDVDKAIEAKSAEPKSTGPSSIARNSVESRPVDAKRVGPQSVGAEPVGAQSVDAHPVGAQSVNAHPVEPQSVGAQPIESQPVEPQSVGVKPAPGHGEQIPLTRMRRAIARRLTESKRDIPHFYVRRTARIDALLVLRKQLNEVSPAKISVNDLVVRAVGVAHTQVPDANVIWTGDGMTRYSTVDVGIAVASSRGLVTPVLRGVEQSSPSAISRQVKEFARQADEGKLRQSDLEGGTITVSNLGMYGVDEFSAIINPPQSTILAVGAGRQAPVVVDGEVRVETQMTLTLSVDHRAIDGALAAQWMAAVVTALEEPLRLVA